MTDRIREERAMQRRFRIRRLLHAAAALSEAELQQATEDEQRMLDEVAGHLRARVVRNKPPEQTNAVGPDSEAGSDSATTQEV